MKSKKLSENLKSKWSLKEPMYVEKFEDRYTKYANQLKTDGFSDTETWSLSDVICEFILPRLIRFKEINNGFPQGTTSEKWDEILDQMIFAFDLSLHWEDEKYDNLSEEEKKTNWMKYEIGMDLFRRYFRDLWW